MIGVNPSIANMRSGEKTRRTEGESDREIAAKSLFTAGKDKANLQYRGLPEYSFYEHLGECNAENKCLVYFKN